MITEISEYCQNPRDDEMSQQIFIEILNGLLGMTNTQVGFVCFTFFNFDHDSTTKT